MNRLTIFFVAIIVIIVIILASCDSQSPPPTETDLVGEWRSVIESPGGELPFTLRISQQHEVISAVAMNGKEEVPFSAVKMNEQTIILSLDWYDSVLEGELAADRQSIVGHWRKTIPGGFSELPWRAERGSSSRFRAISALGLQGGDTESRADLSGSWKVLFSDDSGEEQARAEFQQAGESVTGTFLTATGDYRFLEGSYESGLLRLSTFDGAHVFLFQARSQSDGTLEGDFWSRDSYHATWSAEHIESEEHFLPDPWQQVQTTQPDRRFRFSFEDLDSTILSSDDPRFHDKVVLVNLFGTWCPNCNDEAPLLADWSRRWQADGLEIVGLAFEFSGDESRDRQMLRRFAEHHKIEYPLLLAGISDKAEAALAVPDLSAVLSYPTTVFIARDGAVRWIHSGFSGPGTGLHHQELIEEMERRITTLLAE